MSWDILQLDGETATVRDVKKAYARLLKGCRPDQNPEGFRELHAAYEAALAELGPQGRRPAATAAPFSPTPDGPSEELRPSELFGIQPVMKPDAREEILTATAGETIDFSLLEMLLRTHPAEAAFWSDQVAAVIRRDESPEVLPLPFPALLLEIQHGFSAATLALIDRMDRLGQTSPLFELGRLMLEQRAELGGPKWAHVLMTLACAEACWLGPSVDQLADAAFPDLAADAKQPMADELQYCTELGQTLKNLPLPMQLFWRPRLENPDDKFDWNDAPAKAAIRMLITPESMRWPGRSALVRCLPKEIGARLPKPAVLTLDAPLEPKAELYRKPFSLAALFCVVIIAFAAIEAIRYLFSLGR